MSECIYNSTCNNYSITLSAVLIACITVTFTSSICSIFCCKSLIFVIAKEFTAIFNIAVAVVVIIFMSEVISVCLTAKCACSGCGTGCFAPVVAFGDNNIVHRLTINIRLIAANFTEIICNITLCIASRVYSFDKCKFTTRLTIPTKIVSDICIFQRIVTNVNLNCVPLSFCTSEINLL